MTGASVSDSLPAGASGGSWALADVTGGGSVTGPTGGSGALAATVNLPVNATVTFTFTVQVDPSATGTLTNTATVSPPAGVTDPTPANNSASDMDTLTPQADLAITKTDGVTSVAPGTANTYTIVVSNAGPSAVTGASVSDPVPAGVTAATWTATDSSGGGTVTGQSSGTGPLATTVDLPVNATVTFTFTVQVDPSATGTLANTATVTPPAGVTDPNGGNNSATDSDSLTPQADLSITKDDGVLSAVPGTSTTYSIVVSNAGPSTAVNQAVTDLFPSAITVVSWTAVASPGSSVAAASGTGNIATTVTLLPGGTVTFTAVAQISPSATGSLTNTATVAMPPGDITPADNSATDSDSLTPLAGLAITKDDSQTTAVPGTSTTYTITVGNAGPSDVTGAALSDPLPAGVIAATWTFVGATGGGSVTGPTSGTGPLATTVNLLDGATVTFSFTATIDPAATGSLVNIATVTPPGGTPTSASDTDTLTPQADLAVTKDDGKASAVPGTPDTYTITVTNKGPSTVSSVSLTDAVPAALLNPVFGTPSAGSYDPATGVWSGLSLASGQSVTITLTGTIDPAATGALTNTARVAPPAGVTDPNPANNNDSDTDSLTPQADLAITKTDGVTSVVPGGPSTTYTIVVSNAGPSAVTGVSVSDPLPAGVTAATWTATTSSGGGVVSGPTRGTGALATTVDLPVNATVTFTFTVQVSPSATGTLDNTATVTPPAGVTDTNPANNSASDTDTLTPQADLAITKTDGVTSVVPGGPSTTYTIVVSNAGPSAVTGVSVSDPLPAGVTAASWTATTSNGGGRVTGPASGSGALATIVDLPVGASVTFSFTAQVSPSATGSLVNTATVTPPNGATDPNPANNSATDTDTLTPQADLTVTKTDSALSVVPGTPTTYTIMVSNAWPQRRNRGQRVRPPARRRHRRQLGVRQRNGRRRGHRADRRQRRPGHHRRPARRCQRHLQLHGPGQPLRHRQPDQHRVRHPARRGDRPQPGRQQRQRHGHADPPGRPGRHQVGQRRHAQRRRHHHLHRHPHRQRSIQRHRGAGHRPVARGAELRQVEPQPGELRRRHGPLEHRHGRVRGPRHAHGPGPGGQSRRGDQLGHDQPRGPVRPPRRQQYQQRERGCFALLPTRHGRLAPTVRLPP